MPNRRPLAPEARVARIYETLWSRWGPQHWWPAQSRFEVIVGAFLTQNTNWSNVETALKKLRSGRVLNVRGIRQIPLAELETLIRSSGYFRQKARRLKNFVAFLDQEYGSSLTKMFAQSTAMLREQLLSLDGIGRETADSILLYAGQHPIFVVDAYTRRLAIRHGMAVESATYDDLRVLFERGLRRIREQCNENKLEPGGAAHLPSRMSVALRSPLAQTFNEMHGLIVGVGKKYCFKSDPVCDRCPLKSLLPAALGPAPRERSSAARL